MVIRLLIVAGLSLLMSSVTHARAVAQGGGETLLDRANAQAEEITDAEAFIEEVEDSVILARSGEYGNLNRGQLARIETSRTRIIKLLKGHSNALELSPDDRIALYNAQEAITSTLRKNEGDRMVCRREVRLGSRVPTTECLTVAEREARRETAREAAYKHQRDLCIPGEGQPCAK